MKGKTRKRGLISDTEIKKLYIENGLTIQGLSLKSGLPLNKIQSIVKGIRGKGSKHELKIGGMGNE